MPSRRNKANQTWKRRYRSWRTWRRTWRGRLRSWGRRRSRWRGEPRNWDRPRRRNTPKRSTSWRKQINNSRWVDMRLVSCISYIRSKGHAHKSLVDGHGWTLLPTFSRPSRKGSFSTVHLQDNLGRPSLLLPLGFPSKVSHSITSSLLLLKCARSKSILVFYLLSNFIFTGFLIKGLTP